MRAVLTSVVAAAVAIGGSTVASLVLPAYEGPAQAQTAKAKPSKKPAVRRSVPRATDSVPRANNFYHQQCTWEDPCRTRNDW
jgi:hypothetical protein